MLIATSTTIALHCPICDKMNFHAFSRFELSGNKRVSIDCECGTNLLIIRHQKGKIYSLQIECNMCEGRHSYFYLSQELWSDKVVTILCDETGVEIGFIGPREKVLKSVQNMDKSVQEMAEELGYGDYFNNPELMYKVLENLHQMASQGKLSCGCDNYNLDVEVYPDRLELLCGDCGAAGIIFAETIKDLEIIQHLDEIILTESTYRYIDDKKLKKRMVRFKNKY